MKSRTLFALACLLVLPACLPGAQAAERSVVVNIRHSRFQPSSFTVEAGTSVRFVVRNSDPIDHEFIVGGPHIQHKHEIGTHQSHGAIPGEISIPAGTTRATTYEFEEPGTVLVGCHLPGHYEFGMKGRITVVP